MALQYRQFVRGMHTIRPLVICGPSGSGKSTILKLLFTRNENCFAFSVSHTTRNPRAGEEDGVHYNFTEKATMKAAIDKGDFLEHAEFAGNMYGTSKASVKNVLSTGKICVLDIDLQGVKNVKKSDLNARYVFLKPTSIEALEERLRGRGTETEETIDKRLTRARQEMSFAEENPGFFDVVIVNDDLETAYNELHNFIKSDLEVIKSQGL